VAEARARLPGERQREEREHLHRPEPAAALDHHEVVVGGAQHVRVSKHRLAPELGEPGRVRGGAELERPDHAVHERGRRGDREREEQQARVAATEALLRAEEDRLRHAKSDYEQARRESERLQNLLQKSLVSPQAAEQAKNMEITSRNELEAAQHRVEAATFDVKVARAGLIAIEETNDDRRMVEVRSPVKGQVLRVLEKSERVVAPGTPLLTIGNPSQLEVVVDVLSSEAVKVKAGMPVLLENWGGDQPLHAKVRTVEPHAFTKVSALGIEEQRVNIVADLLDAPEELGDGYRVDARIITWEGDDVLVVPASALFRQGASYAVFVIQDGRAKLRAVEVGHRGSFEVEVLKGLSDGDRVVIHPPNELTDGKRVKAQER